MLTILAEFRRYMKRARASATIAASEDRRRGRLRGRRDPYRAGQFDAQDEHAQWLGFADRPEHVEVGGDHRDGLAGIEPQP